MDVARAVRKDVATPSDDESEAMTDNGATRTSERREGHGRDAERAGALALTAAVITWGIAVIHLVNGFTKSTGLVAVRVLDTSGLDLGDGDETTVTAVRGAANLYTDTFWHRPLDKVDLIAFLVLVGTACFLAHRLGRRGPKGARDVLEGAAMSRWTGIVLVAVGVVPPLVQTQGTLVRLADAGLSDVLAPVHPAIGWAWVVAGLALVFVVPALRTASRRGRD